MKSATLIAIFITCLVIIVNFINSNLSISISYLLVIGLIYCISLLLIYKINLNTEIDFTEIINKHKKLVWKLFILSIAIEIIVFFAAVISYSHFNSRGLVILAVSVYILAFLSDYLLCTINTKYL